MSSLEGGLWRVEGIRIYLYFTVQFTITTNFVHKAYFGRAWGLGEFPCGEGWSCYFGLWSVRCGVIEVWVCLACPMRVGYAGLL